MQSGIGTGNYVTQPFMDKEKCESERSNGTDYIILCP